MLIVSDVVERAAYILNQEAKKMVWVLPDVLVPS